MSTVDFLTTVYGHGSGWVHLSTGTRQLTAYECSRIGDLAEIIDGKKDVYLTAAVAETSQGSGRAGRVKDSDMTELTALWVDLDRAGEPGHKVDDANYWTRDDIQKLLDYLPIQPTTIVDSGGGWWFYFVLTEPVPLNGDGTGELLLDRWARWWHQIGDKFDRQMDGVFNPGRIVRAPGSINGKEGVERPAVVKSIFPDRTYTPAQIDEVLPSPEPVSFNWKQYQGNGDRPGDEYNRNATVNSMIALLEGHGFHSPKQLGGRVDLTRPNKNARDGHSVTVWSDASVSFWSSSPDGLPGAITLRDKYGASGTYDPYGVFVHANLNGDFDAANRELNPASQVTIHTPTTTIPQHEDRSTRTVDLTGHQLPDTFWTARPTLAHIRQAAHSRGRSADAVLAAVLARIAADTPHTYRIPAIVSAPCGLTVIAGIAGPPGTGKSSADAIARQLAPAQLLKPECDGVPPGSGEGFIELLFDWVFEPNPDDPDKKIKVHKQTRHNAYMYVDEGEVLSKLAGRQSGSTLLPYLRTAFTSGTLGQANASQERKRIVPTGQAVYGVVLGIQPDLAGPLFDEAGAGTPQRILWASTTTPTPKPADRPEWPGPLDRPAIPAATIREHTRTSLYTWQELGIPTNIAEEVAERDHHRQQHGTTTLDEHQDLIQLKVAGLLAVLDGRLTINTEDWQLAHTITDTSRQVRTRLADHLTQQAADHETATAKRLARRQVETERHTVEWYTVETARRLHKIVTNKPGQLSRGKLRARLTETRRGYFEDAIDHALTQKWVTEQTQPGQGNDKTRYHPGTTTP